MSSSRSLPSPPLVPWLVLGAGALVAGCSSSSTSTCTGTSCGSFFDGGVLDGSSNGNDAAAPFEAGGADDGASSVSDGEAVSNDGATSDSGEPVDASTADSANGASTFACNGGLSCEVGAQVCRHVNGGPIVADAAVNDSCVAVPASCASNLTCACLESALDAQQCSEAGGGFSVVVLVP